MSYRIKVSVDYKTKPRSLKVEPMDLYIDASSRKQEIQWVLNEDDLPNGSFLPPTVHPPGFRLARNRKDNPFGPPSTENYGRTLSVFDTHTGADSAGTFRYELSVLSEGMHYQFPPQPKRKGKSPVTRHGRVPSGPIIINKAPQLKPPKTPPPKKSKHKK